MNLGLAEADRLFAGCARHGAVLLAVSGGPDSMALLRLAALRAGAPVRLHVATVDHGLRPEAAEEAAFVAAACAVLGLPHATLPWLGQPKPATRRQERARAARYALLAKEAHRVGATAVLTAHHADDQAETILMRLGRGSGLAGLRGMEAETALAPGLVLLRPLLGIPKEALVALCRRLGQAYVEDPSNRDASYARVRLRRQAGAAAALGLDRDALLRLGRRSARAEAALQQESARVLRLLAPRIDAGRWQASLGRDGGGDGEVPAPEVLQRLLAGAVAEATGADRPLRLDRLERSADALRDALNRGGTLRLTLGGARLRLAADGTLLVEREAPRRRGRGTQTGAGGEGEGAASTQAPP